MVVKDRLTNSYYTFNILNGVIAISPLINYTGVSYVSVITDDVVGKGNWELYIESNQEHLSSSAAPKNLSWIRDAITNKVWELHASDGLLYLLEISLAAKGKIVFLLTGQEFNVYNLCGSLSQHITNTSYLNTIINLDSLIPQEEFV